MLSKGVRLFTTSETYTVMEQIGHGGNGNVYRVVDSESQPYALKLLNSIDDSRRKRFKNELHFCKRDVHPNIVRVIDDGPWIDGDKSWPFYVMPIYTSSLRRLIETGINHEKIIPLFDQILGGVGAAHLHGIWHRDLKPENILYDEANSSLVIADFGIAYFSPEYQETSVETQSGERLGNYEYHAPEQTRHGGVVDGRADIWALGHILNEMFTKQVPRGEGYKRIGGIDSNYAYLDDIVAKMIQRQANNRYQTINDVKAELAIKGNDFIRQQRIDKLRNTVVSESDITDPLYLTPVELVKVPLPDYRDGTLTLYLSQPVNAAWINQFKKPGTHRYTDMIASPGKFAFQKDGTRVSIATQERVAQDAVNYLKSYIKDTNQAYREYVEYEHKKALEIERQTVKDKLEAEQRRNDLLSNLNIE